MRAGQYRYVVTLAARATHCRFGRTIGLGLAHGSAIPELPAGPVRPTGLSARDFLYHRDWCGRTVAVEILDFEAASIRQQHSSPEFKLTHSVTPAAARLSHV